MSVFFPRDQRCPGPLYNILGLAHHRHRVHVEVKLVGRDCPVSGLAPEFCRQLYKNRSSRKIDSQILFLREYDFPKTFSLIENQFSRKTYFFTIGPCQVFCWKVANLPDNLSAAFPPRILNFVPPEPHWVPNLDTVRTATILHWEFGQIEWFLIQKEYLPKLI